MVTNSVDFYIGSPGPEGYLSLVPKCIEDTKNTRTFLVRGSVNESGNFIEKLSSSLEKEGIFSQHFINSYNTEVMDGAYFPDIDTYVFDENVHNRIYPSMLDCRQYTVDLGESVNKKELYLNKALIEEKMQQEKTYITKVKKFLATVQSVAEDNARLTCDAVNTEKIERFVSRFIKREFGAVSSYAGREYFRILTAITPDGISFNEDTLISMCPKLYCIDDKTGFVSSLLISQLRESALICGFDVVSLISPLKKEKSPEHLMVPELGIGIITSDEIHPYKGDCFKRISSTRFFDNENFKKHKTRLKFNISAEKELLNQAFHLLKEAENYREEYFEIYSRSVDKEKIQNILTRTKSEILSFISCT